jgi:hypothetical protein
MREVFLCAAWYRCMNVFILSISKGTASLSLHRPPPFWQAMDTRATSPLFPHEERRKAEVNQFGSVGSDPHPIELLEARICGAVAAQSHCSGRCRSFRSLPLLRAQCARDLVTIWSLPLSLGKQTLVENSLTPVAFLCSGRLCRRSSPSSPSPPSSPSSPPPPSSLQWRRCLYEL